MNGGAPGERLGSSDADWLCLQSISILNVPREASVPQHSLAISFEVVFQTLNQH
jgi:hypothetical protein